MALPPISRSSVRGSWSEDVMDHFIGLLYAREYSGPRSVPRIGQRPTPPSLTSDTRGSPGSVVPDVGETCFVRPDGEVVCVPTGSIYERDRREAGYEEIPSDSPDLGGTWDLPVPRLPYEEIPTDVEISVFEPSTTVDSNDNQAKGGPVAWTDIVDWGIGIYDDFNRAGQTRIDPYDYNPGFVAPTTPTGKPGGSDMDVCAPYNRKRRRRRRPLLTPTDLNTLAALKTITGNNDALKFAVMKAVRR